MESLNGFYGFVSGQDFSVPLLEVILFIILNSFCLLFGRYKLGLLISYSFAFYWGFIFNMKFFVDLLGGTAWGMPIYVLAGIFMFVVAIAGFFIEGND